MLPFAHQVAAAQGGLANPHGWYSYATRDQLARPTSNLAIYRESSWKHCGAPLQPLRSLIHLCSFATAKDGTMLRFFLQHYIDRLGLLPEQMSFHVFASAQEGKPIVELLRQRGVAQVQTVQTPFNDALKLELINRYMRELPHDAWITTPDVDELYDFPCFSMRSLSQRFDLMCGVMEDMLAASGGLEPLRDDRDIEAQFPYRCRVRGSNFLTRLMPFKVVLARVRPESLATADLPVRQFRSVHAFTSTNATVLAPDCHHPNLAPLNTVTKRFDVGAFRHYTLTRQQLWNTQRKMQMHERDHADRLASAKRGVSMEHHHWSLCSNPGQRQPDAPAGLKPLCRDYHEVLRAMELIYNASRGDMMTPNRSLCEERLHLPPAPSSVLPFGELLRQVQETYA